MEIKDVQFIKEIELEKFENKVHSIVIGQQAKGHIVEVDYKPVIAGENRVIYTAMITSRST